jgi:hypothetical protein
MTPFGKVAAIVFIIFGCVVTAGSGLMGNLLAMGGWLLATLLTVTICVITEDRADELRKQTIQKLEELEAKLQ